MNPAALDLKIIATHPHERGIQPRGAIDDHEFGTFQPAGIKVIEELAPSGGDLPARSAGNRFTGPFSDPPYS